MFRIKSQPLLLAQKRLADAKMKPGGEFPLEKLPAETVAIKATS